jgi:hypothetical protein
MERRRGKVEMWLDKHNHKMELIRTVASVVGAICGLIAATTGIFVFLKVFEII